ncbi:MAG: response regulator [Euryarchaeota archaeon]|nr:response regulator [Euryarchaeota archaeon]
MKDTTILVVEDEAIVAMSIKKALEKDGYSVSSIATSGEEAIKKADLLYPDLVLMDILLKGDMDGIEAAGTIREKFDIPIIYLTAHTDEETLERAKATQPYGYISKPFKEEDLRANIEIALHKHENEIRLK